MVGACPCPSGHRMTRAAREDFPPPLLRRLHILPGRAMQSQTKTYSGDHAISTSKHVATKAGTGIQYVVHRETNVQV